MLKETDLVKRMAEDLEYLLTTFDLFQRCCRPSRRHTTQPTAPPPRHDEPQPQQGQEAGRRHHAAGRHGPRRVMQRTAHICGMAEQPCNAPRIYARSKTLNDEVLATAILDRLLYRCEVIKLSGKSYRMGNKKTIFGNEKKRS